MSPHAGATRLKSSVAHLSLSLLQLLAFFMRLDTLSLMMNYIDLRQTKDVQLIFDALLVRLSFSDATKNIMDVEGSSLK